MKYRVEEVYRPLYGYDVEIKVLMETNDLQTAKDFAKRYEETHLNRVTSIRVTQKTICYKEISL